MEDLIFHADVVVPQICACGGAKYATELHHHSNVSNRNHGIEQDGFMTGLIRSVIQYGNVTNRRRGYPPFQLQAAKDLLDATLMQTFHYPYESTTT